MKGLSAPCAPLNEAFVTYMYTDIYIYVCVCICIYMVIYKPRQLQIYDLSPRSE